MWSEFLVYLRLGFEHITDPMGYDHLLFVAALTATDLGRWRRLFWLVTAFTVGHSVTLVLSTLDLIRVSNQLVEVLIPLTILGTCIVNMVSEGANQAFEEARRAGSPAAAAGGSGLGADAASSANAAPSLGTAPRHSRDARIRYGLALTFGLIHGLGFSNFLRAALGSAESITLPLFAFNVGLEVGQLAIVAALSLVAMALMKWFGLSRRAWVIGVSMIAGTVAAWLVTQRF